MPTTEPTPETAWQPGQPCLHGCGETATVRAKTDRAKNWQRGYVRGHQHLVPVHQDHPAEPAEQQEPARASEPDYAGRARDLRSRNVSLSEIRAELRANGASTKRVRAILALLKDEEGTAPTPANVAEAAKANGGKVGGKPRTRTRTRPGSGTSTPAATPTSAVAVPGQGAGRGGCAKRGRLATPGTQPAAADRTPTQWDALAPFVKRDHDAEGLSHKKLGVRYGMSGQTAWRICHHADFAHVPPAAPGATAPSPSQPKEAATQ